MSAQASASPALPIAHVVRAFKLAASPDAERLVMGLRVFAEGARMRDDLEGTV